MHPLQLHSGSPGSAPFIDPCSSCCVLLLRSLGGDGDDTDAERGSVVREGLAGRDSAGLGNDSVRRLGRVARRLGPGEDLQRAGAGDGAELGQREGEALGGVAGIRDLDGVSGKRCSEASHERLMLTLMNVWPEVEDRVMLQCSVSPLVGSVLERYWSPMLVANSWCTQRQRPEALTIAGAHGSRAPSGHRSSSI